MVLSSGWKLMATIQANTTPTRQLFPEFICCNGALRLVMHVYVDANTWEARCPKCGRIWWVELIGIETEIYKKDGVLQDVKIPNN